MPHTLIAGMTESGKTTLAKRFAARSKKAGRKVLVLDPMLDDWQCDYQTSNPADFLNVFWREKSCDAYIDESGDTIGHYESEMIRTATRGRHWGHNVYYITQRPTMISPSVRTQCRILCLFVVGRKDAEILSQEYNEDQLKNAYKLDPGVCYVVRRHAKTKIINVFD